MNRASSHESLSHWQMQRPVHRRRLDRHQLDQRPRRDDHPAHVLRDVAREPVDLLAQVHQVRPQRARRSLAPNSGSVASSRRDAAGEPPSESRASLSSSACGQAEHLAQVAHRAAQVIGRERAHQRRVLVAIALGTRAGSAARGCRARSPGRCRGRRAGPRSGSGRARGPRRPGRRARGRSGSRRSSRPSSRALGPAAGRGAASALAHLARDLAASSSTSWWSRKKPARPRRVDQGELLVEPLAGRRRARVLSRIAARRTLVADPASCRASPARRRRRSRGSGSRGLRQVERSRSASTGGARDRVAVVGKPLDHLVGGEQHALAVAAPLLLAAVERGACADRDERVLQRARRGWCAWTSPVARVSTPSASASS